MEAALARDGRAKDFLPLETQSLNWPDYIRFLHRKYPQKWPELVSATDVKPLNPIGPLGAINILSKSNELYYLHPSFGYYFEQFYLEPHGLVYKLKTLPDDTLLPPPPDKNLIAANEAFWARAETRRSRPLPGGHPPEPNAPRSLGEQLLNKFHVPANKTPTPSWPELFIRAAWISGACSCNAPMNWKRPPLSPWRKNSIPIMSSRKSISISIKASAPARPCRWTWPKPPRTNLANSTLERSPQRQRTV